MFMCLITFLFLKGENTLCNSTGNMILEIHNLLRWLN